MGFFSLGVLDAHGHVSSDDTAIFDTELDTTWQKVFLDIFFELWMNNSDIQTHEAIASGAGNFEELFGDLGEAGNPFIKSDFWFVSGLIVDGKELRQEVFEFCGVFEITIDQQAGIGGNKVFNAFFGEVGDEAFILKGLKEAVGGGAVFVEAFGEWIGGAVTEFQ